LTTGTQIFRSFFQSARVDHVRDENSNCSSLASIHTTKDKFENAALFLSPGDGESQVVLSSHKLKLVAKRSRKCPRKYTQVGKKTHFKAALRALSRAAVVLYFIG